MEKKILQKYIFKKILLLNDPCIYIYIYVCVCVLIE